MIIDENKKTMHDFMDEVERIRKIDFNKELNDTKAYWRKYVKEHDGLKTKEPQNSYEEKILNIPIKSAQMYYHLDTLFL